MTPSDWLLLFVAARSERPVDPVRVQKGLFLLAMRGTVPAVESYAFEPYAYGPMSRAIYRDCRDLQARGLLESVPVDGQPWRALRPTAAGRRQAQALDLSAGTRASLDATRAEVDGLSFAALLARVYDAYPEFAVRSVFRRR